MPATATAPPTDPAPAISPTLDTSPYPGVPHTAYDEVDPTTYLGLTGREATLINKQGLALKSYFWPAPAPRCVLLFVHGHGAHLQFELLNFTAHGQPVTYEGSWAQALNAAGVSVCGIDNQGCGRSQALQGRRFYVDRFQDYVDDVLQLAKSLNDPTGQNVPGFTGVPAFLAGISLGGCIAFNASLQAATLFRGTLLLAPMLSLERVSRNGLNPYLRPFSALFSALLPSAAIVATDKNAKFPAIQAYWDADPLTCHTNTRVRNANEYLNITEATMARLEDATFPFIVFHSENDTMCDVDGSKALYLRAGSADKTLRLVNQMWHILVKEEGNEKVRDTMIEWMLERI